MIIGLVLSSTPGYSETFFRNKIKGLQSAGHEVVLFTRNQADDFDLCPVKNFPERHRFGLIQSFKLIGVYLNLIPAWNKVRRFIKLERQNKASWRSIIKGIYFNAPIFKQRLDWLHFGFGTMAIGRENLAQAVGSKMAVSFRGFDIGVYPVRNPGCYSRLWKKVDKIHVISDDLAELVRQEGFNAEAPVVKITPAIDTDFFQSSEFNPVNQPLEITTVARLHWKKGLDYTLQALARLKERGIRFNYNLIGTGPEYENLKFACHQLGLDKEVKFLGVLKHEEVKSTIMNSMIYLQYSVQEGFCNAVLEAQAMGLLCIVSDAEGLSENVLHERTGWVVPKRNSEELTSRIQHVIQLPIEQQKSISFEAMERVRKTFDIKQQVEAFLRFYE